ncbi:hypothetical protein SSP35_03_04130 [Streptomyces sp. NBRC 110611]|uniref:hypothetical protein n=1 Tax=Streptomyces sp. NBRC 110611 TaxID=1621259 RepID=UPI0008580602|nr:hypothetical protein [Streptomyces sp. NBRC 110611]GAU66765.1 hypothetical protein SSP35_03_04130 [Streptomyces sp. NBRC 110611]
MLNRSSLSSENVTDVRRLQVVAPDTLAQIAEREKGGGGHRNTTTVRAGVRRR